MFLLIHYTMVSPRLAFADSKLDLRCSAAAEGWIKIPRIEHPPRLELVDHPASWGDSPVRRGHDDLAVMLRENFGNGGDAVYSADLDAV